MLSKVLGEITYPFPNFNGCNIWSLEMDYRQVSNISRTLVGN